MESKDKYNFLNKTNFLLKNDKIEDLCIKILVYYTDNSIITAENGEL